MLSGHVFIATSLDGFIARRDHSLDWLMKYPQSEGDDGGFSDFMDSVDGLVMGAGTLRTVLGFGQWPYEKHVYVPSLTLAAEDIPEALRDKITLTSEPIDRLWARLTDQGWSRAYVDGGQLVQSCIRAGLISTLTITQVPVLIGQGLPLFGRLDHDLDLKLTGHKVLKSGFLQTTYEVTQGMAP